MSSGRSLVAALDSAEVFRLGSFTLKSGQESPIYIDLRRLIAFPALLREAVAAMWAVMGKDAIAYDVICGVPYAAFPLAAGLSLAHDVPMLMRRKEAKAYGTKKIVEGLWEPGQRCLIIEDTVTMGDSILETAEVLRAEGLAVTDAIVLVDRSQGAQKKLSAGGITLHSAVNMDDLMGYLTHKGTISKERAAEILTILKTPPPPKKEIVNGSNGTNGNGTGHSADWSLDARLRSPKMHPQSRKLLELMKEKQTNLCLAADFTTAQEIIDMAESLGPELCLLKVHADIIEDFSPQFVAQLKALAAAHRFLIMEDRKFADTGSTVERQVGGAPLRIRDWADFATLQATPGDGVFKGLGKAAPSLGLVVVAEMSGEGALTDGAYAGRSVSLSSSYPELLSGFVCQRRCAQNPALVYMTPGIRMSGGGDGLGQQFRHPGDAVKDGLTDVIIVGRGITAADDPKAAAKEYRKIGWEAFLERDGGHS